MRTDSRYQILPSLLLGFHGTDARTAERVLDGKLELEPSRNEYDWLGHGIYFWEYSPSRAWDFAEEKVRRGEIESPQVIGAVIAPGLCLNLLDSSSLTELRVAFEVLELSKHDLPENVGGEDLYKRYLDCAVIEMAHEIRRTTKSLPPFDTVRGAFWEGRQLYPSAGFKEKNHVQLCVRNRSCIKGYFRPLSERRRLQRRGFYRRGLCSGRGWV